MTRVDSRTDTSAGESSRSVVGNILRGSLGNLVEWYDFYVFSAFAVYFGSSFFSKTDPLSNTLNVLGIFAVGFLMRPIGGWLFGRIADRRGRRYALTLSVLLMAAGSAIILFAPTYETIGSAAAVLLLIARLLQGLSVGGEYGTSATYMSEVATRNRRGYYSSFQYVTLVGGQVLALTVQIILQQVLSEEALTSWGWRIAFGIGALTALSVLWLRRGMDESLTADQLAAATRGKADSTRGRTEAQPGTLRLLFSQPKPFFLVFGLTLGGTVAFYTYTTYMQLFMINTSGIPKTTVTWVNFLALLVFLVLQPVYGHISDRIGRRPLLLFFGIGGVLITWPILSTLAGTSNPVAAFGLMLGALVVVCGYTSINAIVKAELFPSSVRALGVGLAYGLANAIFGGSAPYVGTWFKSIGHERWFFTYVTVCIALSLAVYAFGFTNKGETHLDRERGHAYEPPTPVAAGTPGVPQGSSGSR
jgi:MHS family alpha-ketoglutarate permease-like MFS transporter